MGGVLDPSGWGSIVAGASQMVGGLSPVIVYVGGFFVALAVVAFILDRVRSSRPGYAPARGGASAAGVSRVGGGWAGMTPLTSVTHASHGRGRVTAAARASVGMRWWNQPKSAGLDTVWAASTVAAGGPSTLSGQQQAGTVDYGSFAESDLRKSGTKRLDGLRSGD